MTETAHRMQPNLDDERRYYYRGWIITRTVREWDWVRRSSGWDPKVMWTVHRAMHYPRRIRQSCRTLRAAKAWVDAHGEDA